MQQQNVWVTTYLPLASTLVVSIATVVLAWLTARYVRLTARIVEESHRSREPAVTVDFEMPDHSLRLVIENHGLSPAKNTQIEVLKDVGWLSMGKGQTGLVAAGPIREGVSYLTPGRKLKYYLGFPQWTDTPDDEMETSLLVTYEDDSGKHF